MPKKPVETARRPLRYRNTASLRPLGKLRKPRKSPPVSEGKVSSVWWQCVMRSANGGSCRRSGRMTRSRMTRSRMTRSRMTRRRMTRMSRTKHARYQQSHQLATSSSLVGQKLSNLCASLLLSPSLALVLKKAFFTESSTSKQSLLQRKCNLHGWAICEGSGGPWCSFPKRASSEFLLGEGFLLTVGAFVLTAELLCLPSVEVFIRCTFPP